MFKTLLDDTVDAVAAPCEPVNKILFLKTHKTGSSTVTNILNRYGDSRDLMFALPVGRRNYHFFWPRPFRLRYVMAFARQPDILCNHARYNKAPMHWLFPKGTTRYITMLRDPTEQFESIFNFFKLQRRFRDLQNLTSALPRFVANATFYFDKVKRNVSGLSTLLKNPALFELGLDTRYHGDFTVVRNYIRFLQREFDLVMLMEYFDESLVLLKRRFCWKIEDILYFKLNERRNREKQELSELTREQIRKWNSGDFLLYDVFNKTLWKMIEQEGPDFYKDLALFRKAKETMEKTCLQEGKFLTRPYTGRLVKGYALKPNLSRELRETCNKMIMNEIPFVQHHRNKMFRFYQAIDDTVNQPYF